jgi:hypothetical protein
VENLGSVGTVEPSLRLFRATPIPQWWPFARCLPRISYIQCPLKGCRFPRRRPSFFVSLETVGSQNASDRRAALSRWPVFMTVVCKGVSLGPTSDALSMWNE